MILTYIYKPVHIHSTCPIFIETKLFFLRVAVINRQFFPMWTQKYKEPEITKKNKQSIFCGIFASRESYLGHA